MPLNEGRSLNPGDTRRSRRPGRRTTTLNEGRSLNPGDTIHEQRLLRGAVTAQRRPESEPRRHRPAGGPRTAAPSTLNEGRSLNPGDTS